MSEQTVPLKHPIRYRLEAAAARTMFRLLGLFSVDRASGFGGWLGRTAGPLTRAHAIAERNLARAMPELDANARAKILAGAWDNFGRTMTEYAVIPRLEDRVTIEGHDELAARAREGRPALMMTAHLANWEVIFDALRIHTKPITAVYRKANNPLVDEMIAEVRLRGVAGLAPKGPAGARIVLSDLKQGGHVVMLVDQKLSSGVEAPFFGRPAATAPAIASFALRLQCPVFPIRVIRLGGARFKVSIEKPWLFSATDDHDADVLRALTTINQKLESWIREHPDQWLWMHRRWREDS
ncbi:MAG: lauroyl acyltransferase [Rhodospirillaceae bacterium]